MADKMKEQQRQQQEQARREAAKKRAAAEKEAAPKTAPRRSTRANEDTEEAHGESKENTDPSQNKKIPTRGRPKKNAPKKGNSIVNYLKKDEVALQEGGPSVREALAEAADEYETKPEGLGAQELVATQQPELVTGGKMREYQLEGLEWLKSLWMNGLCGILADEMGLGKTVQAISMIAFFKEKNISGPFLIAAPLSTINNWIDEFARWTPEIKTIMYHGSKDERAEMRTKYLKMQDQAKFDFPVVCTSYEICMNDRKFLANYKWRYIIVDEGHRLKNMNCRLIKELLTYNSANRLLITGTPLQNNIAELWSLLHFLLPEVFNDLDSFEGWFDFSSVLEDKTNSDGKAVKRKNNLVSTMHAILKPFLLRRVKTDVESSLPKKREYILYAPLTAEQKDLYREILSGTSRNYLEGKAVERIEARSRTASLKRKANDSGRSTPAKSIRPSRDSTPASAASTTGPVRRGRKAAPTSYKDISDREFNSKLRRLENGEDDSTDVNEYDTISISSSEQEEISRAQNLKAAKKEIAAKKLQNPIMQARLACNSPHNFYWPWPWHHLSDETDAPDVDETLVTASGKMLLLDRLLPRLFSLGHKVLIFSQFKTTLDIIQAYASDLRGWACCRIDGSISQAERSEQIKAFNTDPEFKLFLLSTRAGGQGINLVAADTVILFDSDWNPQQDLQAMDRAHRIGQTRPVIVYRLATRGTVEETLLLKADGKRKLEKLVIQKGKFKSLFDGMDAKNKKLKGEDAEDLKGVLLANEEFEKYDLGTEGKEILTEDELKILTDRSEKAYERAEKGLDVEGTAFKVAETKKGNEVLGDLSHK
jgi:ATP-dependent DNA helicase